MPPDPVVPAMYTEPSVPMARPFEPPGTLALLTNCPAPVSCVRVVLAGGLSVKTSRFPAGVKANTTGPPTITVDQISLLPSQEILARNVNNVPGGSVGRQGDPASGKSVEVVVPPT